MCAATLGFLPSYENSFVAAFCKSSFYSESFSREHLARASDESFSRELLTSVEPELASRASKESFQRELSARAFSESY